MRYTERQRKGQREKPAPHGEPDAGLNPRTPGPQSEPKADCKPLSHPGVPRFICFREKAREEQAYPLSVEPDMELNLMTLRS